VLGQLIEQDNLAVIQSQMSRQRRGIAGHCRRAEGNHYRTVGRGVGSVARGPLARHSARRIDRRRCRLTSCLRNYFSDNARCSKPCGEHRSKGHRHVFQVSELWPWAGGHQPRILPEELSPRRSYTQPLLHKVSREIGTQTVSQKVRSVVFQLFQSASASHVLCSFAI